MESYKTLTRELIEQEIAERLKWARNTNDDLTRTDVLADLSDHGFEDIFGNLSGSRTCNTYEAQRFIDESGAIWDDEILDLFAGLGDDYFMATLARGPETLDVVICELVATGVLYDMAREEGVEL